MLGELMTLKNIIETESLEQIEKYLKQNANKVEKGELDDALRNAAFYGDKDIAELLIKHGADVNVRQENKMSPLECAIENMQLDMIKFLLKNGANVNSQDGHGVTPLHRAIDVEIEESNALEEYPPSIRITSLILAYNPDVKIMDFNGRTPLDWAIGRQHIAAIELLNK